MDIERIKTGIGGLDELLDGGFPKNTAVLVLGGPGTGKTILGLQFLSQGAKDDEVGLYVSFEESIDNLVEDAKLIGIDMEKLCNENKVKILFVELTDIGAIIDRIHKAVKEFGVERVVIDSLSTLSVNAIELKTLYDFGIITSTSGGYMSLPASDVMIRRRVLKGFINAIKEMGVTSIMTYEDDGSDMTPAFICDGVIDLRKKSMPGGMERTLTVEKMRKTEIDGGIHNLEFTKGGLKIMRE